MQWRHSVSRHVWSNRFHHTEDCFANSGLQNSSTTVHQQATQSFSYPIMTHLTDRLTHNSSRRIGCGIFRFAACILERQRSVNLPDNRRVTIDSLEDVGNHFRPPGFAYLLAGCED